MKFKVYAISGWTEDNALMAGDASHEGDRAIQTLLEEERRQKIDDEWQPDGLPMVVEAEDEDDLIDVLNDELFPDDYLKAGEVDAEPIEGDTEAKSSARIAKMLMRIAEELANSGGHTGNVIIVHEYVTEESARDGGVDESMTEKEEHPNITLGQAIGILNDAGLTTGDGGSYYSQDSNQSQYDGSWENTSGGVSGFSYRDESIIDYSINEEWPHEGPGDVEDMINDLVEDGSLPKGVGFDWDAYTVTFGGKEYEYDFDMSFEDNLPDMKAALGI